MGIFVGDEVGNDVGELVGCEVLLGLEDGPVRELMQ